MERSQVSRTKLETSQRRTSIFSVVRASKITHHSISIRNCLVCNSLQNHWAYISILWWIRGSMWWTQLAIHTCFAKIELVIHSRFRPQCWDIYAEIRNSILWAHIGTPQPVICIRSVVLLELFCFGNAGNSIEDALSSNLHDIIKHRHCIPNFWS